MLYRQDYMEATLKKFRLQWKSHKTIETYKGILNTFLNYCYSNQVIPEDLSPAAIEDFILAAPSNSAQRQRHGLLKNLYKWVIHDPGKVKYIPFIRKQKRLPVFWTVQQYNTILNAIPNPKQRTAVQTQYALALRVHEVVKLRKEDFIRDFSNAGLVYSVRLIGKGDKECFLDVPDETMSAIIHNCNFENKKPFEYIFEGQYPGTCYDEGTMQAIIKNAKTRSGLQHLRGSTHALRHSRLTHLTIAGMNQKALKDFSRHQKFETLEIYQHLDTNFQREERKRADEKLKQQLRQSIITEKDNLALAENAV